MSYSIDRYLSTLLAYTPASKNGIRNQDDFACLIHVPAKGNERVYSVALNSEKPVLSYINFKTSVSEWVNGSNSQNAPRVDVLRSDLSVNHPALEYVSQDMLEGCENLGDACMGLDYYLLLWRVGSEVQTSECWEPFASSNNHWKTIISAFQVLVTEFEVITRESEVSPVDCCDSLL